MSQGVISSELMLFEPKAVNEGVEYLQYIECRPTNQITEDGSVDIHIKASGSQYLDLQRSRLHVKAKIVKEDGSNLEEADVVTPVNLWMQSLFNQVDVYFQQKLVSSSGTNYAYKAYMDVLLNFSEDAETSQMQTQLFYKDSARAFDQTKTNEIPLNQGLILRQKLAKNSQLVDMCGPICADTFNMSRYLLNEVDVRLKLFQSKHDRPWANPRPPSPTLGILWDLFFLKPMTLIYQTCESAKQNPLIKRMAAIFQRLMRL